MFRLVRELESGIAREFTGKVFGKVDLEKLIEFFSDIFNDSNDRLTDFKVTVIYEDGSFKENITQDGLDDTKLVKSIELRYWNYTDGKLIEVNISDFRGKYLVKSKDEDWQRAKASHLDEYLKTVPNQNWIFTNGKLRVFLPSLVSILLGFSLKSFLVKMGNEYGDPPKNDPVFDLVFYMTPFFFSFLISMYLFSRIFDLYPPIEFDNAREHLNKKKKVRTVGINIFLIIVLPLLLSIISSTFF